MNSVYVLMTSLHDKQSDAPRAFTTLVGAIAGIGQPDIHPDRVDINYWYAEDNAIEYHIHRIILNV